LNAGLEVDPLLLAGAVLLTAGVVIAGLAQRSRAPAMLLFLALGMAIGDDGTGWVSFDDAGLAQAIAVIALVVILFEGGLSTSTDDLRSVAAPASVLATLGVVITGLLLAGILVVTTDVDTLTCMLIGAVVASTDAAAVFSVMRTTPVRRRLTTLIETESAANDPVAVLMTVGVLVAWESDPTVVDWVLFGLRQLVGGLVVGLVVGVLAAALVRSERLGAAAIYPVFAFAVAGVAYGVGTALGASGFLAVYVAGVAIRAGTVRHRGQILRFHQGLASVAQITLFLILGLLVFPAELLDVAVTGIVAAAGLIFVARPIAVGLILPWFGFRLPEVAFAAWGGLRGAVPIVLATFPLTAGYPDGALVFDVVFFIVLASAIVQGLTLTPVARVLKLGVARSATADVVAGIVPIDLAGLDVVELEVGPLHAVAGCQLIERPMPPGTRVAATVRGEQVLIPDGHTRIEPGDMLVVVVPQDDDAVVERLERWVTGVPQDGETADD
jgi:cell volume regulation protein A